MPTRFRIREVRLPREVVGAILEAHHADPESERCGVLLGRTVGERVEVDTLRLVENAHPTPAAAFRLDAAALLRASADARERGLEVVGTWHSHPRGSAALSDVDVAGLADASLSPGAGGVPERRPHVFVVSGSGAGRAVVLRAFASPDAGEVRVVAAKPPRA